MTLRELELELIHHHARNGLRLELVKPSSRGVWRLEVVQDDTGLVLVPAMESPHIGQLLLGAVMHLRLNRGKHG